MKLLTIVLFQILCLSAYVLAVKSATLDLTSCTYENPRTHELRVTLRSELWVNNGYHNVMDIGVLGAGKESQGCSSDGYFCISGWNDIYYPTSIQMQMNNDKRPLTATNKNIKNMGKVCGGGGVQGNTQQYFFEMWA